VEKTQRLSSRQALVKQKLESMSAAKLQLTLDITELERRISLAREKLASSETSQETSSTAAEAAKSAAEAQTRELEEVEAAIAEASRLINEQKTSYLELAKNLAAKRNSLQHARERVEQLGAAVERYGKQIEEAQASQAQSEVVRTEAAAAVEAAQAHLSELQKKSEALVEERKAVERELGDTRSKASEISRDIAGRSSRLATLKEMAEVHEGFFEGVRSVMGATKDGKLRGEYHVVADVLDVPKGYETAVEVALGANLQDIITPSVDEAKQAIEYLKSARAGRATFLPLDGMRPSDHRIRGDWNRIRGAIGIAADLVGYDSRYDAAIRSLLGRTIMTETVDDAIAVSRNVDGWNKIVTLEGEIIVPSGAIAGGAIRSRTQGILLRKQEIEALQTEIKSLEVTAGKVQAQIAGSEKRLTEITAEVSGIGKETSVGRDTLEAARQRLDRASEDAKRTERQIQSLKLELEETSKLREEQAQTAAQVETELQTGGAENSDLDRRVAEAESEIANLEARRTAAREKLLKVNVELAGASERTSSILQSISETTRSLADLTQSLENRRKQVAAQDEEESQLSEEAGVIGPEVDRQRELLEAAQQNTKTLQENRHKIAEQAKVLDQAVRETTNVRNKISQSAHDADVKEARLDVQLTQAAERLLEEYELGLDAALEWPEDELSIERGTATEVARLRREIKEMGPVNTGAVQEYERIKERWDFLVAQRTDLESAGEQISSAIGEIDINTEDRFMETFNSVAANFDIIFKRLFSGGRTELSLTNPKDLLETGIEISVQPPGKKLQDLALLSGGERALTATALIFALLKSKPSPFVVMDELDAPLDETNVERFADVLQEFARDSQFIVVTHNRATMEAAANLYGVTMQEPGISRLLSVKLSNEGVEGNVEPVASAVW
jgi:chromosome segregation protein